VIHEGRVSVIPRDRPIRVDDEGLTTKEPWPGPCRRQAHRKTVITPDWSERSVAAVTESKKNPVIAPLGFMALGHVPCRGPCRTGASKMVNCHPATDETCPHIFRVTGASYDVPDGPIV